MKIVASNKAENGAALVAAKAALEAGAAGVIIERAHESEVITIHLSALSFCPVTECSECTSPTCSAPLQRAGVMTVAEAQQEYDVALEKLKRAERNIQIAVDAHG